MNKITILKLDDLKELDDFIDATNDKAMTVKGLVVASDGDIKAITGDIRELKQREDVLKIAESKLIKLAGIDRVGYTIENSREQRLLANKNVQHAKQEIKNKALDFFISNADELIKNSQASDTYKQTFNPSEIASNTISGKSKGFMDLMKTELGNLGLRLDNNARETSEKLAIINKYDDDMVRDKESLLQMPIALLEQTLVNRKNQQEQKIKQLADKIEAERLAKIEADKIEAERFSELEKLDKKIEANEKARAEKEAKIKTEIEIKTYNSLLTTIETFVFNFNGIITFNVMPNENCIIFYDSKNEIVKDIHFKFKIDSIKIK